MNVDYHLEDCPAYIRIFLAGLISFLACIFGLFVPRIEIMFSVGGSFCGGLLGYVMPAMFILLMKRGSFTFEKSGKWLVISTYLVLVFGLFSVVFGTSISLYSLFA